VIAVCGEALVDLVAGVPHPGGGPFNTARALARLGVPTAFLGRLSTDVYGQELARLLREDGVDTSMASLGAEPTTAATVTVDSRGVATYTFRIDGTSAPNLTTEMLPERLDHAVRGIHVGTLGLLLEPVGSTLIELVRRESAERLVMLDPNIRPVLLADAGTEYRLRLESVIAMSTIVKASEDDLAWLYPELDYAAALRRILRNERVEMAVATLGPKGAYAATRLASVHVGAPDVTVVDTIGAGDVFGASLLAWLNDRNMISPVLKLDAPHLTSIIGFACAVSALCCTRAGADSPRLQELIEVA
jgi:fructokinase